MNNQVDYNDLDYVVLKRNMEYNFSIKKKKSYKLS